MKGFETAEHLPSEWDTDGSLSGPRPSSAEGWAAPDPEFPKSGVVLEGKYRLLYRLASGNMSSVWFAEHLVLAAPVAIKFMQTGLDSETDVRRRFLREARIASAVRSPHVVKVLDCGVHHDTPFIVMEFLRGESLARRIRRFGRLSPRQTAEVLAPLAHALRRAHELGVVHRDLEPDNIFITTDGGSELTKLLDFGVAKVRERGFGVRVVHDTADGEIVGTPHYMSPEQARGERSVDHRTDVWAFGVIAFECLLGFLLFVADGLAGLLMAICTRPPPVPSTLGAVPAGFDGWFARACNHAPEARFSSLQEAVRHLSSVCNVGSHCAASASLGSERSTQASMRPSRGWFGRILASQRLSLRWLAVLALVSLLGGAAAGAGRRAGEASRAAAKRGPAAVSASVRPDALRPVATDPRARALTAPEPGRRKTDL